MGRNFPAGVFCLGKVRLKDIKVKEERGKAELPKMVRHAPKEFVRRRLATAKEKGIVQLMQAAQHWAASRGLSTLRVATQMGNTAALKRYILSGANVESTAYWLYR